MPCYITEYATLARDAHNFHISAGKEPAIANQEVAVAVGSTQSAAFNAQTAFVMIHCEEATHLKFGSNPTAVTTEHRVAAGETRFYGVTPGHKVATIAG